MKLFYEHYIRLAHIGKGANANVYKVRHAELGYVRAIKVLNEEIEDKDDRVYQSFLKECKTLLTIGNGCHPNIVRIYGPDLINNHAIVEMDYIQGKTMDSYIKQKGFIDYEEVKTFIKDIVGALAYTHYDIYDFLKDPEADNLELDPNDGSKYLITPQKEAELVQKYSIVHNDLHSNNIMRRDYDGRFVLLDFGLAVQAGKCVKSSRMRDGSPEYQAPEKFDSDIIDPRSDVYSLGILMYEILAGRVPFEIQVDGNGSVSQHAIYVVLNQHQSATPPPILPLRKAAFERQMPGAVYERDYPEWIDDVIMKCLAKKKEDRYKNAKELLCDINAHLKTDESKLTEINKSWQDAKSVNVRSLEHQNATTSEPEKSQVSRENVVKVSQQLHKDKKKKERPIFQSYYNNIAAKGSKKLIIFFASLIAIILGCYAVMWLIKNSGSNTGDKVADTADTTYTEAKVATAEPVEQPANTNFVGAGFVETAANLNMTMVWVDGGEFSMGATSEQGTDAWGNELPVCRVKLDSYYIGECEVTQAQWERVMDTSIHQQASKVVISGDCGVGPDYPMYWVSWEEAQAFCAELSRITGRTYCLPTEAQWEYAARGGKKADGAKYSGSWSVDNVAWYSGNSGESTHPVKTKRANGLGLYDMSGNVWEWCSDWYDEYNVNDTNNPTGPSSGSSHVLRGGCWYDNARNCRVSSRNCYYPGYRNCDSGFRVALIP